ncbi:hypothetical protein Q5V23_000452 [Vibrio fluvialis]|nr:hypothetical protein [Vibrio fluvialis]
MSINRIIAKPTIYTFSTQGRVFQLLSGAEIHVRFHGVDDTWSEEVDLVAGDSLKFDRDFFNIEISSEFETSIEFYAGFADMRRATTDLTPVGCSQIATNQVMAEKVQKLLVSERRNRRSLTIIPLQDTVYIGALGADINSQIPIAAGQPVTLDVKSALYVTLNQNSVNDTSDVRILEEIN